MNLQALCDQAVQAFRNRDLAEAERLSRQILGEEPGNFTANYLMGLVATQQQQNAQALAHFNSAIATYPEHVQAHMYRAFVLGQLDRIEDALADYDAVVAIKPQHIEALYNRGRILWDLYRFEESITAYDRLLTIQPDHVETLCNRAVALWSMDRFEEALADSDRALAINPGLAQALFNRGNILMGLKRPAEAAASFEQSLALGPDYAYTTDGLVRASLNMCDWARTEKLASEFAARTPMPFITPLNLVGLGGTPAQQLECAKNYVRDKVPVPPPQLGHRSKTRPDKIRIAYVSSDFREHPMSYMIAGLLERHDRSRFEVHGLSLGIDDGGETRARVMKAFDHFHDVRGVSDSDAAGLLHRLDVDIAIDLNGHTLGARPKILAARPCPVQVTYLGTPATLGADYIDYVIADKIVLSFDQQKFFTEKIVHLPDSYWVNDSTRPVSDAPLSRAEVGLPQDGFVFCCFNNNWKITRPLFDIWMRLLTAVPGSVLWLLEDNKDATIHLRTEAARRGVDPARLIFAPRVDVKTHLPRHRLADLCLDTLPYNAHTTAVDALWTGLPVVTCPGDCFAARVAASLLTAIGLPELVTGSLAQYESLALELAKNPAQLQSIRHKLEHNRLTTPLFDTDRFRRNIESAYATMLAMHARGEAPSGFAVAATNTSIAS